LKALNRRLRTRPLREIEPVLGQLGDSNGHACERHRLMDVASISALATDNLFEIGSHAATHTMLSAVRGEGLADEVTASRRTLADATGHPVTSLAYPYGTPDSYTAETVKLARRSGYERACANIVGRIGRRTAHYELPRCMVYDWSAGEFGAQVTAWFEGD
jgi:peptidoglycan/xylan/chitin deacetylase (PgdA/CDA1 family)